MTGQAEIKRREGKRGGLWHGRRKNFPGGGNKVSLQRPWAGKKPDTFKEGQGGCQAVNKKKSDFSGAGEVGQGQIMQPSEATLRILVFILRAKGCY